MGWVANLLGPPASANGGYLLLRPWEEQARPFNLQDGTLDGFSLARNLFLQNQAYRVGVSFENRGDKTVGRIELQEETAALGELQISGRFIHRMVLSGGSNTVVLHNPEQSVKIPVGSYPVCQVQLRNGTVDVCLDSGEQRAGKTITVNERESASLTAGGPLTNSVTVKRRGSMLVLSYRLGGADGRTYRLIRQDRTKPPQFTITQGDKQIASGAFEFG
jgi:hypothetical protein